MVAFDAREGVVRARSHLIGYALEAGQCDGDRDSINGTTCLSMIANNVTWMLIVALTLFLRAKVHLILHCMVRGGGLISIEFHRAYHSSHLKVSPAKITQILSDATDATRAAEWSVVAVLKCVMPDMGGQNSTYDWVVHG